MEREHLYDIKKTYLAQCRACQGYKEIIIEPSLQENKIWRQSDKLVKELVK